MQLKKRGVIVVRNISKGLSLILVFTLFLGSVFIPGNIASAEEGDDNRLKLQIISDDFKNYIYLYEEEGNNYKVIEKADDTFQNINSRIYIQNKNGDYELDHTLITNVKEKYTDFTIEKDNIKTTERIYFGEALESEAIPRITHSNVPTPQSSSWNPETVHNHSSKINKYTVVAVTGFILGAIAYHAAGPIAAGAATSLNGVVNEIISSKMSTVYYRTYRTWRMEFNKMHVRTRTFTYKSSDRKTPIDRIPITTHTSKIINM